MKLEVKNGSFGYGKQMILQDLNFSLEGNKIMTVLGPNGAGKTTLLKCIMGFLKWKEGQTWMNGNAIGGNLNEFWRHTSYVPQAKQSVYSYRVVDVVIMGLNAGKNFFALPSEEDYEKAFRILKLLRAEKLAWKSCSQLSGGERQMVMMARALISEPELLILDEPESNLDMKNQLQIVNAIQRASEEFHTSCLINTHFPNNALKISDITLMLGYNQKKILGNTLEVVTEDHIREYFQVCTRVVSVLVDSQEYHTIFPYQIDEGPASSEDSINPEAGGRIKV